MKPFDLEAWGSITLNFELDNISTASPDNLPSWVTMEDSGGPKKSGENRIPHRLTGFTVWVQHAVNSMGNGSWMHKKILLQVG